MLRKRLKDHEVRFIPASYGDPFPNIEVGESVYIVDFSYPRDVLEEAYRKNPILVIDHHKTALETLKGLPWAIFDMGRSGAGLTWDSMFSEPRYKLIDYIEDRDLWKFALPSSREAHTWLSSFPKDFIVWDRLMMEFDDREYRNKFLRTGAELLRFENQKIQEMAKEATLEVWQNYKDIPTVNVPYIFGSSICDYLLKLFPEAPFAIYWFDRVDRKRQVGIRGRGTVDVSAIAQGFGGGGHHNAAGFLFDRTDGWVKSR